MTQRFGFKPYTSDPGVERYEIRWNGKAHSELLIRTAAIVRSSSPNARYEVQAIIAEPARASLPREVARIGSSSIVCSLHDSCSHVPRCMRASSARILSSSSRIRCSKAWIRVSEILIGRHSRRGERIWSIAPRRRHFQWPWQRPIPTGRRTQRYVRPYRLTVGNVRDLHGIARADTREMRRQFAG